jgi:hypothetical protein
MADSLLALLLVTKSASGSFIAFRWPPDPKPVPRLARPRPPETALSDLDNPWRAFKFDAKLNEMLSQTLGMYSAAGDEEDYEWHPPGVRKDRASSFASTTHTTPSFSVPASGRSTPSGGDYDSLLSLSMLTTSGQGAEGGATEDDSNTAPAEYRTVLGFASKFLANLLAPARELCHQRFELTIDDLAFIGHPVCVDSNGKWSFGYNEEGDNAFSPSLASSIPTLNANGAGGAGLQTFHLVLVLDLPDPSARGPVARFFDAIYENVAFAIAAVLFHAQATSAFVEQECDVIALAREEAISSEKTFTEFAEDALSRSNIANAMKLTFEHLKKGEIARVEIAGLSLEMQIPPKIEADLTSGADVVGDDEHELPDPETDYHQANLDSGLSLPSGGWGMQNLAPWKSLLLLDGPGMTRISTGPANDGPLDLPMTLGIGSEDRLLAEGLLRFLSLAHITRSLASMAATLSWDLDSQVYPTVRWLVQHRRAVVMDVVHPRLKTRFALAPAFSQPLSELSDDFKQTFPDAGPLPLVLAATSVLNVGESLRRVGGMNTEVLTWLLRRELLVRLHLRIRIRVPPVLKAFVRQQRLLSRRGRKRNSRETQSDDSVEDVSGEDMISQMDPEGDDDDEGFFPFSPRAAHLSAQHLPRKGEQVSMQDKYQDSPEDYILDEKRYTRQSDSDEDLDEHWSIIAAPGAATSRERRWLAAMSADKEPDLAARFDLVNQYFDGRCTDDEIMYRGAITRRQFREVIGAYGEYVSTLCDNF